MFDEECISPIQFSIQARLPKDTELSVDYLVKDRGLTSLNGARRLDAGGTFLLISIFLHQAPASSCEIGFGSVSPHCFSVDIVKLGPSTRHKCQTGSDVYLAGGHVDWIRDASSLDKRA